MKTYLQNKKSASCCLLLAIGLTACEPQAGSDGAGLKWHRIDITWQSDIDGDAAFFLKEAAVLLRTQMKYTSVGKANSSDPQIRTNAKKIFKKHKDILMEIERVAYEGKLLLPQELPFDIEENITTLSTLKGKQFDREYIRKIKVNHKKIITAFNSGADVITKNVSQFAKRTLSLLVIQ